MVGWSIECKKNALLIFPHFFLQIYIENLVINSFFFREIMKACDTDYWPVIVSVCFLCSKIYIRSTQLTITGTSILCANKYTIEKKEIDK